ncbi:MAG: FAD-binding oxidoreductase [Chitinispirillaceae bacterium]|nr:FAD-binding oxidoreductase [Chitinispirillaceae bacterium]
MKQIAGCARIREEIPDILHDESRFESGVPSLVCFPETIEDLQNVLSDAAAHGRGVTFIGAQTGTTGGAVPDEGTCAIAFSAMNRIRTISWEEGKPVLVCDPGVTLDTIERFLDAPATWPYQIPGSEKLAPGAFFYPPDPTEMTAQLGGTVATNASGARSYRFGPTRSHIAWLDLVLADGDTITVRRSREGSASWDRRLTTDRGTILTVPALPFNSPEIKNAAGYFSSATMDAVDLFIGSEGTLAAISGIGIALQPAPTILSGLTFFGSNDDAFNFADFLQKEADVAAIEFFDNGSLRFIDQYRIRLPDKIPEFPKEAKTAILWEYIEDQPGKFETIMERWEEALISCGSSFDATWSGFDDAEKERLHSFRHALPEMVNSIIAENKRSCREIRKIGTDSAFSAAEFRPAYSEMMRMIETSGLVFAAFGHLGDHHIHINLIPSTPEELSAALKLYDELMALALRHGGTVSAEHGIGKIKKKYLRAMYGEEAVAAMCRVRAALDPKGMLNPGNLF